MLFIVRVVASKSIGFVTYSLRVSAEFAKEAMADQTLDSSEVINVRWANEDPNPAAKAGREQELLDKAMAALSTKFPDYYKYFLQLNANGQYPNTEQQYAAAEELLQKAEQAKQTAAQQAYDPNAYFQYYYSLGYVWDPTTNSWTTHDGAAVALPDDSNGNNGENKEDGDDTNKDENDTDGKVSGSGFLSQYYDENYGDEDKEDNKDGSKAKSKADAADLPLYPATADPAAMDKPLY